MRIKKHKAIGNLFIVAGMFSLILALVGEWETAGALWLVIICLLPALWLALGTSYLGLKIFCATALISQIVTLPAFYLRSDKFAFSDYRPFGFGALDAMPAFIILGLFLWMTACLVKMVEFAFGSPVTSDVARQRPIGAKATIESDNCGRASLAHAHKYNVLFSISILFLLVISLPVKLWMFKMGIGLVGTPPPQLPYRLSGILFYSFNYLVPIVLGGLYIKTKRNSLLLALIVSIYAVLVGIASVSKSVIFLPLAPIIAFAWLDRRWVILTTTSLLTGIGVQAVVIARSIVHIVDGNAMSAFTELGVLGTLQTAFAKVSWSPELLLVIVDIGNRFEGFQSMFLASQFNSDAVGGAWNIFFIVVTFGKWGGVDHDAIHLEYLGYTIPEGLYGVGATITSWMMLAANNNIIVLLSFATHAALTLVILERTLMRASRKYLLQPALAQSLLFFAVMWFYTAPATQIFYVIFVVSIIFSLIPALVVRRRLKYRN